MRELKTYRKRFGGAKRVYESRLKNVVVDEDDDDDNDDNDDVDDDNDVDYNDEEDDDDSNIQIGIR